MSERNDKEEFGLYAKSKLKKGSFIVFGGELTYKDGTSTTDRNEISFGSKKWVVSSNNNYISKAFRVNQSCNPNAEILKM